MHVFNKAMSTSRVAGVKLMGWVGCRFHLEINVGSGCGPLLNSAGADLQNVAH